MKYFLYSAIYFLICFPALGIASHILRFIPRQVDMGTVKVGATVRGQILIDNLDVDDVEIVVGANGTGFSVEPTRLALAAGGRVTAVVTFTVTSAGEYRGEVVVKVNNFLKTAKYSVPVRALAGMAGLDMVPDPGQGLDLGAVPVGTSNSRDVVLSNPGVATLLVRSISLARKSDEFDLVVTGIASETDGTVEIVPGADMKLKVRFQPLAAGTYENILVVDSPDLGRTELLLRGQGLAPIAAFSPLPEVGLDFGKVELGQYRTQAITVLNHGRADLSISDLASTSGAFVADWDSGATVVLAPGKRRAIPVTFRPRYEGKARGQIVLKTSDREHPEVQIAALGAAQQYPPRIEILNRRDVNFGNVAVGRDSREQLVLWNQGGTPFTVSMDIEGVAFGEYELEKPSLLLQPGEVEKVELRFSPRETGERRAELGITTESGTRILNLFGVGKFLELSPTSLDFDRVVVGKSSLMQTEIVNLGNADFTTTNIVSSNPDMFSAKAQVNPTSKHILQADGLNPLPVSLTFTPRARGVINGVLQVQGYWDEAFETREILLSGTGIAADLELHPSGPFDFDFVVLGQQVQQTVIATNTGDTDLRVESHAEATEAWVEPAAFKLPPGQSRALKIVFSPEGLGNRVSRIRLISNDVKEKALPLSVTGKGSLDNVDLSAVVAVLVSQKNNVDTLQVGWNNAPLVLPDQTKIDVVFKVPEELRPAMIGRKFNIEWTRLDANYDEQGGPKQLDVLIQDVGERRVLAEKLNLRLLEDSSRRVRLRVSTQNHGGAPIYVISQVFEAGGWKWEFEAKPLVSFLSIRPGRNYSRRIQKPDGTMQDTLLAGHTERLIGLPGFAFFGWHNSENPSISGVHLTAMGNVLEALSTENSIAVSLGIAVSFYKDRFMFGLGWDIYDHRPKADRDGTKDYIMTFKYWGLRF